MDNELELTAEGVTEEEIAAIRNGDIQMPVFPYMVFSAAVVKDTIDVIELIMGELDLGLMGIVMNTIMLPLMYNYVNQNLSLSKKYLYKRAIGKALAEFVPVLSSFSFWSFFVWRAHANEKKKMEKVLGLMESQAASKIAYRRAA